MSLNEKYKRIDSDTAFTYIKPPTPKAYANHKDNKDEENLKFKTENENTPKIEKTAKKQQKKGDNVFQLLSREKREYNLAPKRGNSTAATE